ncbi:MAG: fluoride efflux transporter CrcB [Kiloniellales bacterium]
MSHLFAVAAGGALGALGRYAIISQLGHRLGGDFPAGTIVVNVLGSFILGLIAALTLGAWSPPPELHLFLTAGLLGALTTFSTFALDVAYLSGHRAFAQAAIYVLASVLLSVGGFFAGLSLLRAVLA